MALLRIILIALLIYYTLKFIVRLIFPWLAKEIINKASNVSETGKKREGDVTIQDVSKGKDKVIDKNEGEYVDYEEVD
jgi:hypothetical protein